MFIFFKGGLAACLTVILNKRRPMVIPNNTPVNQQLAVGKLRKKLLKVYF